MAKKYLRYVAAGNINAGGLSWSATGPRAVQGVDSNVAQELKEQFPDRFEDATAAEAEVDVRRHVSPMGDVRWVNPEGEVGIPEAGVAESNLTNTGGDK